MQPLITACNYSWVGPAAVPSIQPASPRHARTQSQSPLGIRGRRKTLQAPSSLFPLRHNDTSTIRTVANEPESYPITVKGLIETCLFMAPVCRRGAGVSSAANGLQRYEAVELN